MTNLLQNYTLKDFVKCRNQKEWVCDNCMKCGDRDCCSGNHIMFRVPKTDDCLCSICMSGLKWNPFWENYETWNVALWINNDEGLYHLAMEVGNYVDFIDLLNDQGIVSTPDGVKYNDPAVNVIQLNSDVFDL